MSHNFLTPDQLSELLQVPVGVLAQWRCRGEGPKFIKLGGKHVRYSKQALDEYLNDQERSATQPRRRRQKSSLPT